MVTTTLRKPYFSDSLRNAEPRSGEKWSYFAKICVRIKISLKIYLLANFWWENESEFFLNDSLDGSNYFRGYFSFFVLIVRDKKTHP